MATENELTGILKWFDSKKGFGFIRPDKQDRDVFVHVDEFGPDGFDSIGNNEKVSFNLIQGRNGKLSANKVAIIKLLISKENLIQANVLGVESVDLNSPEDSNGFISPEPIRSILEKVALNFELIREISPKDFEQFCSELLRKEGFDVENVGNWNQADGGIDILAVRRGAGRVDTKFAIQCKRSNKSLSATVIRQLSGVLNKSRTHQGVIMTTGFFTKPAILEKEQSYYDISLRDFNNLLQSLGDLGILRK